MNLLKINVPGLSTSHAGGMSKNTSFALGLLVWSVFRILVNPAEFILAMFGFFVMPGTSIIELSISTAVYYFLVRMRGGSFAYYALGYYSPMIFFVVEVIYSIPFFSIIGAAGILVLLRLRSRQKG